jgi:hypothetical protein
VNNLVAADHPVADSQQQRCLQCWPKPFTHTIFHI